MADDSLWWLKVIILVVMIFIIATGGILVVTKVPNILSEPTALIGIAGVETGLIMVAIGVVRINV